MKLPADSRVSGSVLSVSAEGGRRERGASCLGIAGTLTEMNEKASSLFLDGATLKGSTFEEASQLCIEPL